MLPRVTKSDLTKACSNINTALGTPKYYWADRESRKAAVGHYLVSDGFDGYCLHKVVNVNGGVLDIFACGHVPARTLYCMMQAYLQGLSDGRRQVIELSKAAQSLSQSTH